MHDASIRILSAITDLVEDVRGQRAPDAVWDRKLQRRVAMAAAQLGSAERVNTEGQLAEAGDPVEQTDHGTIDQAN